MKLIMMIQNAKISSVGARNSFFIIRYKMFLVNYLNAYIPRHGVEQFNNSLSC